MAVPPAAWEGGAREFAMLQAAMSDAAIVCHAPPDFPFNAEILGVCAVSAENADQNKYGWMVADFLHWKLLFYGVGAKAAQTWLSTIDIPSFLASVDGVDMINDGTIDSIVGTQKRDVISLPGSNHGFLTAFLDRLAEAARVACSRRTALVLLVFCPITPEQDICVDLGGEKTYLTSDQLRMTIGEAIPSDAQLPVILVTPSPFTGGWLCRPSFMGRPTCDSSHTMMRIIAMACGGAFADRFISSFTERDSPLMTEAERAKVKYNDPMPLRPTAQQIDSLHRLHRQIHESLEHRFSTSARDHAFILNTDAARDPSVFSDSWLAYAPRRGRGMTFWASRWRGLRPVIDHTHRFECLGEAFGGTRDSQLFHLRYLAAIELDTCPGDWARQVNGATSELLKSLAERLTLSEDDVMRVLDAIEFRSSSMALAQMVAKAFNLPVPDGESCRYWNDKIDGVDDDYYKKLQAAFGEARDFFSQVALLPSEKRHEFKNVRFWRAARWLSAAVALHFKNGSVDDVRKFVSKDVARLMAKVFETQKALLLNDQAVNRAGRNWIAALGLNEGLDQGAADSRTVMDTKAVSAPANPGIIWKNTQGPAATLGAQAATWSSQNDDPIFDLNLANKTASTKVDETQQALITSPAMSTEAESSLAHSDMQHAVEDLLESFDTWPAMNNKQHGNAHQIASETEIGWWQSEVSDAPKRAVEASWPPAFNLLGREKPKPTLVDIAGQPSEGPSSKNFADSRADSKAPILLQTNDRVSRGEGSSDTLFAFGGNQEKHQVKNAFQGLSDDLHDLGKENFSEPGANTGTGVRVHDGPSKSINAGQPPIQGPAEELLQSITAGMKSKAVEADVAMYLARVLRKASEIIMQEQAEEASCSASDSRRGTGQANVTVETPMAPGTKAIRNRRTSSVYVNTSQSPVGTPPVLSSSPFTISNPIFARSPGASGSEDPDVATDADSVAAVYSPGDGDATSHSGGGQQPYIAEEEDFWALSGIKW